MWYIWKHVMSSVNGSCHDLQALSRPREFLSIVATRSLSRPQRCRYNVSAKPYLGYVTSVPHHCCFPVFSRPQKCRYNVAARPYLGHTGVFFRLPFLCRRWTYMYIYIYIHNLAFMALRIFCFWVRLCLGPPGIFPMYFR